MTWVDLILKTESKPDQKIRVMKFVLELSSPVFHAAFKENNFSNAASLEYEVAGYSETVVKSAIRRLNGYALDDIVDFDAEAIEFYMEVYLFANEYQIPLFEQLFESIVMLYDSNALCDLDTSHKDSLFVSAARFYGENKPGYVERKCRLSEEKYSEMTRRISNCQEEFREPCSLGKGCSYYDTCHCWQETGEWSDGFIEWIIGYDGRSWDKCLADKEAERIKMEERERQRSIAREEKRVAREKENKLYMDRPMLRNNASLLTDGAAYSAARFTSGSDDPRYTNEDHNHEIG
ncbi:hypothetical protein D6D01_01856 [Aureobasidium pullulans]|uniref:BTB domain-containing protein n=1 Tax=Aureobasidium pullulans TaxID=5580 RepID=A0A4V4JXX2_AURPU|nr:hypothetical protein D6D01_01856 [Aureobasidium pullulans]